MCGILLHFERCWIYSCNYDGWFTKSCKYGTSVAYMVGTTSDLLALHCMRQLDELNLFCIFLVQFSNDMLLFQAYSWNTVPRPLN